MNYTFSTLNDKEFEQICRDLLNAKLKLNLQSFKSGRDGGVDLRFSTPKNNNSIVVQAKHYIGSTISQLKSVLLNHEIGNLQLLSPDRYIVVTSLALLPHQKDEIKTGLSPYVLSSNDILGQEDLNALLIEFPEIEKNYFKLWFSSVNVFNAVLHNAVEGRTKYLLEQIRNKIPFYVVTKKLDSAISILQKEKLLLITGQPGIGKTTLAEIILFERARKGFKIYKVENIREAEDVISLNDDEKQLFYFDDFLGANYFEIVNAHKTETQLTSFVERLKNTPNKYLILTTRTIILNYAFERYEKISHSKLANHQFEIKLADYNKIEKAFILYNHLYFKGVKEALYNSILKGKFYKQIIEHKNYTPRIIEFITEKSRIDALTPDKYHQFILNNLNNPKEIWRYSYTNQIDYLDRCLLITVFTLDGNAFQSSLISAFERRLDYEKSEHNQIIVTGQFDISIKILLNGFISSILYDTTPPVRQFQFINPSLTDFLIGHVTDSFPERKGIVSSIKYIEQLDRFNPEKSSIPLERELQVIIRNAIAKSELQIIGSFSKDFTEDKRNAIILETLCRYCSEVNIDTLLLKHFKLLTTDSSWYSIVDKMIYVMKHLGDAPQTYEYIKNNFIVIIELIMRSIDDEFRAKEIPSLFESYEVDFEEYIVTPNGNTKIIHLIAAILRTNEDALKKERRKEVMDLDDVAQIYDELDSLKRELMHDLMPDVYLDYDFGIALDEDYWNPYIEGNNEKAENPTDDFDNQDYYKDSAYERMDEDKAIDDLFDKPI